MVGWHDVALSVARAKMASRNYVGPPRRGKLVMCRQVRLHPAVVLVALAIGGAVAGILGAFVAVPLAAMATAAIFLCWRP